MIDIGVILVSLDFADKVNAIVSLHVDHFDMPKGHGTYQDHLGTGVAKDIE